MSVFVVLGVVGLVVILASLVVGDLVDGVLDGLLDALSGDVFSTAVIGSFVSAFGFGGAIAEGTGGPIRRQRPGRPGRRSALRLDRGPVHPAGP